MPFAALGVHPALVQALAGLGHTRPSPIQTSACPPALRGHDLIAQAPTGSGKTLAYALPLLQRLMPAAAPSVRRPVRALVLVPTRELAQQVGEVLADLAYRLPHAPGQGLRQRTLVGGVSINPQLMALRGGADMVVATPGRLLDVVQHNGLSLGAVGLVVLDEADRLLDQGFAAELQALLALLPARRQTLLFSATLPPAVAALAEGWLHQAERVSVAGGLPSTVAAAAGAPDAPSTSKASHAPHAPQAPDAPAAPAAPGNITQRAIQVDTAQRTPLLRQLLRQPGWQQVLVFVATRHATEHLAHKLAGSGVSAAALHGTQAQGTRSGGLRDFRDGRVQVLVATDVAARGLDISGLPVVLNYDLPRAAADHTHRIGRTGRAGHSGLALSFICADSADGPNSEAHFRLIEKRQQQRVPREQWPGFEPEAVALPAAGAGTGGVKGRRPSKKDKLRAQGL